MQIMSEANDLPPVTRGERVVAVLGLLAVILIGVICVDLATGGRVTGRITGPPAEGGGCVDC